MIASGRGGVKGRHELPRCAQEGSELRGARARPRSARHANEFGREGTTKGLRFVSRGTRERGRRFDPSGMRSGAALIDDRSHLRGFAPAHPLAGTAPR
jgi:hypothetical protein